MMTEEKLMIITGFAKKAHGDQKRKYTGEPYVYHTIAVSKLVKEQGGDLNMQAAALLHDVLEDTRVGHQELRTFLYSVDEESAEDVLQLVVELTDVYTKESFPHLNRKVRKELEAERLGRCSARAKRIKLADMEDNTSSIVERDPDFAKVYLKEKARLLEKIG